MCDPVKCAKKEGLIQSLIDLERQCYDCKRMILEGTQRFAGSTPKEVAMTTAKAMLHDVVAYENINGADAWSEEKRQFANQVLKGPQP